MKNDMNVRRGSGIVFIFSMWPKSEVSTWQISDVIASHAQLDISKYQFREVNIKRFNRRLTFSFHQIGNEETRQIMKKIIEVAFSVYHHSI